MFPLVQLGSLLGQQSWISAILFHKERTDSVFPTLCLSQVNEAKLLSSFHLVKQVSDFHWKKHWIPFLICLDVEHP